MRKGILTTAAMITALLTISILTGCSGNKKPEAAPNAAAAKEEPVPVDAAPAETRPVQRTVGFVGSLEAFEETSVASMVEAPVSRVYVDMGDSVAKGQILVKLDDEDFRIKVRLAESALNEALARLGVENEEGMDYQAVSQVKKARAELANAEKEYNRMKELEKKGYVSRSQLDDAQAKYDMSRANIDTQMETGKSVYSAVKSRRAELAYAKKKLSDTEIRAPFSGYIAKKLVDCGDYAKVGMELITIVAVDPLRMKGEVPEVNAPEVRKGQEVGIKLQAAPGKEYSGRINRISPSSRPESRAFIVEVLVPNPGAVLKPGYFAEANIKTQLDPNATVVPLNSVLDFAGVNKVYVVKDGKAYEKIVKIGVRTGDYVEVSGDIKSGDMVVLTGMKKLYDGKTVIVKEAGKGLDKADSK